MDSPEVKPEAEGFKALAKRHGLSAAFCIFAIFRVEVAQDRTQATVSLMSVNLGILVRESDRQRGLLTEHSATMHDHERRILRLEAQLAAARRRSSNSEE